MTTIGALIDGLARQHERRPALIAMDRQVSYRALADDANRVAQGLAQLGVSKGTRVGILLPNCPEWLACAFGALKLGALLVPLNTLHRKPELAYALRHADVTVLLMASRFLNHAYTDMLRELCPALDGPTHPLISRDLPALRQVIVLGHPRPAGATDFADVLAAGAPVRSDWLQAMQAQVVAADAAAIFFTSGTTAAPKGVVHTHDSMLQAAHNVADRLGLTPQDRTWGYLPFFFTGGLVAVALATLSRGGAVLLQDVFDAGTALKLMAAHGCTTLFAWPHQAEALLAHPDFARTRLRLRKGVGANTSWGRRLFPPDHLAVGTWGMTESGPMAASSRHDDPLPVRAGSHGRAMPGLEFRIVDPESGAQLAPNEAGELLVRGRTVMARYYKLSPAECFDAEGFFHTGDLARLDETGHLHFLGRIKDVIKTAGVNVAAAEVEAVLRQHPHVTVASVTGVPHATRGENVAALVVRRDDSCTEAELVAFCRQRLASYKVPRHIFFCREADLPVLGSGKVDKQALRRLAIGRIQGAHS
ncbi:MAG: class I adenylate-forming enzyme family protein [Candidatus Binatia bacterium]